MATELATAYVQIVPSAEGISGEISKVLSPEAEKAGDDAGDKAGSSFVSKMSSVLSGGAKAVGAAAVAVGTAAAGMVAGVVAGTKELAAYGDQIDKNSQKFGISAQAYQEWDAVLQHSGTSIEAMKPAFKNLASLAENNAGAFEKLGLSQEQVASMSTEDLFAATIAGLQNMEEGSERTALATELLGKAGMELGPLLNTSAEDTQAMIDRVNELGGVLSDDSVKAAAAFQDSMQDMQTAMAGAKNAILADFMPGMTTVMDGLTELFGGDSGTGVALITEGIGQIASGISEKIPEIITTVGDMVGTLVQMLIDSLPEFMEMGVQMLGEMGSGLGESMPSIIESITSLITQLLSLLVEHLPDFMSKGMEIIGQMVSGIGNSLPSIISAIVSLITSLLTQIVTHLPEFLAMGLQLIVQLAMGLVQAIPQLVGSIPGIISAAVTAFTSFNWGSVGRNIISGIVNGLVSFGSNIASTLMNIAKSAFDSVLGFFGIHSPSTLFRDMVGKNIAEGWAEGLEDNATAVTDAIDEINDMTLDAVNTSIEVDAIGKYQPSLGSNRTTNNMGGVVINVNASDYSDPQSLAIYIRDFLVNETVRNSEVFA